MKIPKCPKTVTGKHIWWKESEDVTHMMEYVTMTGRKLEIYPPCTACGIVDDRKRK